MRSRDSSALMLPVIEIVKQEWQRFVLTILPETPDGFACSTRVLARPIAKNQPR